MAEIVPIIVTIVLVVLAIVVSVVGIQVVLVLNEIRRTLRKVNQTVDLAEAKINAFISPMQNLGGMASGLNTGFKMFETFIGWLNRNKDHA
jgi:uncharacterized protein YoxC